MSNASDENGSSCGGAVSFPGGFLLKEKPVFNTFHRVFNSFCGKV